MGNHIVIAGSGGMGREAAGRIAGTPEVKALIGFVDNDPALHGTQVAGP